MRGLRIRHPITGRVLLQVTDRITRIIYSDFSTGVVDGSLDLSTYGGTPVFHENNLDCFNQFLTPPSVWVDGQTLRWTFRGIAASYRLAASLVVGVR